MNSIFWWSCEFICSHLSVTIVTIYFNFRVFNLFELVETNLLFKFIDQGVSLSMCNESELRPSELGYFILTYQRVQALS